MGMRRARLRTTRTGADSRFQNSGCYYNSIYQWTNEPCEPGDAGYECTAA